MRKFIGTTSHVRYFSKFTNISITSTTKHTLKIYLVPDKIKTEFPDNVDVKQLTMIWTKEMDCGTINTIYDPSNYSSGNRENINENFRLIINGECVHASQYIQKYLIEFNKEFEFVTNETSFVDH